MYFFYVRSDFAIKIKNYTKMVITNLDLKKSITSESVGKTLSEAGQS